MKIHLSVAIAVAITSTAAAQRISVAGTEFRVGHHKIWISGANTPWKHWNDFGGSFDETWWSNHFRELKKNHINATRVWVSCDGNNPSPGIQPDGTITSPSSKFWTDLDKLFQIAKANRVYLMLASISFDHTKKGNHNADRWQLMQRSAKNRASFVSEYIVPLVKRYRSNPYFFAIDVGNELDWHWDNQGMKQGDTLDLIARVSNAVHQNSQVLVCQGMGTAAKYLSAKYSGDCLSDRSLGSKQAGAHIDFYNIHYYDWVRRWFSSPFEQSPEQMGIKGKPAIVGETPAHGSAGMSIQANYQKAFEKGWQGFMPWTSNGVDNNGSLKEMAAGSNSFFKGHGELFKP